MPEGGFVDESTNRPASDPLDCAACARLTVIIPCDNVAATCEAAIRETAHRVDRPIVVADGSNDGTGAIPTVYRDGNRGSYFRPMLDSMRILWTIMAARLTP